MFTYASIWTRSLHSLLSWLYSQMIFDHNVWRQVLIVTDLLYSQDYWLSQCQNDKKSLSPSFFPESRPCQFGNAFILVNHHLIYFFQILYLFLENGEVMEKEGERIINIWLLLAHPQLETRPAGQSCALTGNPTSDPLVHRPVFNSLSHTSQCR